ncbi:MAG TPA: hypothetical protein VMB25_14705 [Bryobacteraceae bacterium]|nr:hypothetical protein [Bryobacteraceae bacterium]
MSASPQSQPPAEAAAAGIQALRASHQVRELQPAEEGASVHALPAGVYGFAYAPGHEAVPLFAKESYHAFEVHKAADGVVYLIGFLTPQEAASLDGAGEGASFRLFPAPWESSQSLVSVPLARIVPPKRMPREDGNPFPFAIA